MRLITDSWVFNLLDDKSSLMNTMLKLIDGKAQVSINHMDRHFSDMRRAFKNEPALLAIETAVKDGRVLPYISDKKINIPTCMPFFKYKKDGKEKVAVNLTNYITNLGETADFDIEWKLDCKKLYYMLYGALAYLEAFNDKGGANKSILFNDKFVIACAEIWSRLFCKVLNSMVALNTDRNKYAAVMYICSKFFVEAFCGLKSYDERVYEKIANYDSGYKYIVDKVDAYCEEEKIDLYKSDVDVLMTTLFRQDLTGISSNSVNVNAYLKKYIQTYDFANMFSLGSFPYFFHNINSAGSWAYFGNDAAFEDIIGSTQAQDFITVRKNMDDFLNKR